MGPKGMELWDLLVLAGFEDARKSADFRNFLRNELDKLEEDLINGNISSNEDVSPKTPSGKALQLFKANKAIHNSKSYSEQLQAANLLIDAFKEGIDIKKIIDQNPSSLKNIKELPKLA